MCGIAGLVWFQKKPVESLLYAMAHRLHHRGPDDAGIYIDTYLGLAHTRLSILDIEHGQQPFVLPDHDEILIYNGEIFNYQELKTYLSHRQIFLKTHSDTELLYRLLLLEGKQAISKINGQFAFCFYRPKQKIFLLARDYFGEKPLAYYYDNKQFIFASEIKAILPALGFVPDLDPLQVQSVMTYWSTLPEHSAFQNIQLLPPGMILSFANGAISIQHYQPDSLTIPPDTLDQERLKATLSDAAKRRLLADVPVAAMISGGLDSAIIGHEINPTKSQPKLSTFSISFTDKNYDERKYQTLMAEHLKSEHHTVTVSDADIIDHLEEAVWFAESPSPRLAFVAMYCLHQYIKQSGIKVVLSGEGADEMFLGYDIFREVTIRNMIRQGKNFEQVSPLLKNLNAFMKNSPNYLSFLKLRFANYKSLAYDTFALASHDQRVNLSRTATGLLSNAMDISEINHAWLNFFNHKNTEFEKTTALERAQQIEIATLLSGHLLSVQGDRMAMAHSVETRAPFLDTQLNAYLKSVNYADHVITESTEKEILKSAYQTQLPLEITKRTKFPFRSPDAICFHQSLTGREYVESLISDSVNQQNLFNPDRLAKFISKFYNSTKISPRQNHAFITVMTSLVLNKSFKQASQISADEQWQIKSRYKTNYGSVKQILDW